MEKSKKLKLFIGLFYLILLSSFLVLFFSKFDIGEVTSYHFIQTNTDYLFSLKESNLIIIFLTFFILTVIWVFLMGFGSPVALLGGFIFGKWLGTLLVAGGLSVGATLLYLFSSYFLKDLIKEKFLYKYKNLETKFKKNELNFFLLYRFVGGIPFQIANILPVLFNINVKNYFLGTFIGIIPQIFIYTSLGSGLEKVINRNETIPSITSIVSSPEIYIPLIGFIMLVIITIIIKKLFYKN